MNLNRVLLNLIAIAMIYCLLSNPQICLNKFVISHCSFLELSLQASCENLSDYLLSTLNPYIANVTAAAQICSDFLCQGNGRCVRRHYNTDTYLHLNPDHFLIQRSVEGYMVTGVPSVQDFTDMFNAFTCQCYAGRSCSARVPSQSPHTPLVIHI